ncbi:MAG: aldose epimerase family protein [Lachnospiraceae bacterium]
MMTTITKKPFGTTSNGEPATLYTMTNATGASVTVTDFGGSIVSVLVPDRDGNLRDVVLGYDDVTGYETQTTFFGALIGRCGNRIEKGQFELNGKTYQLYLNDGNNHLHGGRIGYDKRFWNVTEKDGALELTLHSPDGEEGYPGNLDITVVYTFDDNNVLGMEYTATTDADTVCNLTNHSYFNLNGHDSGSIVNQQVRIVADQMTLGNDECVPIGEIVPVEGTVFDLRDLTTIADGIDADDEQIRFAGGYDHNWVLSDQTGNLALCAQAYAPESGIFMDASTTLPGMQFYAGNFITSDNPVGKNGVHYDKRHGFCFESQVYPNATTHRHFPSPFLKAGDTYHTKTTYAFSVK